MIPNDKSLTTLDEIKSLGDIFVKSGFFSDTRDASQAVVKILVGRELGLGPMASMMGVNIIKGKPSLAANVMAAKVKASGKYDYRVLKQDAAVCEIEYLERSGEEWRSLGKSTFTIEDARRAETQNLAKYPRNMLFARAMSNGVKWFCPDITQGLTVYEPTELGAEVDEDGKVVNGTTVQAPQAEPERPSLIPTLAEMDAAIQAQKDEPPEVEVHLPPGPLFPSKSNGHTAPEQLSDLVARWQKQITRPQTEEQIKRARQLAAMRLSACAKDGSDSMRHAIVNHLFPDRTDLHDMEAPELYALRDWLQTDAAKDEITKIVAELKQTA